MDLEKAALKARANNPISNKDASENNIMDINKPSDNNKMPDLIENVEIQLNQNSIEVS
jgi:hypothetical protein